MKIQHYKLNLDLLKQSSMPVIYGYQLDNKSRYVDITLTANGAEVTLDSTMTAVLNATTNNVIVAEAQSCKISGNLIEVELTDKVLSLPGAVKCEVVLSDSSGTVITAQHFLVKVTEKAINNKSKFEPGGSALATKDDVATAKSEAISAADALLDKYDENTTAKFNLKTGFIEDALCGEILSKTVTASAGKNCTIHLINKEGKWAKNSIVKLTIMADDTVAKGKVAFGVKYNSGTEAYIVEPDVNEEAYYITTDDTVEFIGFIAGSKVIGDGNVTMTVEYVGILEQIVNLHNDVGKLKNHSHYEGKTFSIIGDSYSAYQGWIPENYVSLYGNPDKTTCKSVISAEQMWWYILSQQLKMSLINNGSWEGTTICTTGYGGTDYTSKSFVTRAKSICGEDNVTSIKPDVIFIFGGTNDDWANAPIGSVKYADWTTDDLKSVLPAFCYLLNYIKLYNPQATTINIINEGMDTEIAVGMSTACDYYNVINIELTGIDKESNHPTATGQAEIAKEVISVLQSM